MSETKLSKFANKEVLEFYRSLPFNYYRYKPTNRLC